MFQKRSLLAIAFALCANISTMYSSVYLYDQLMPQLLKGVDVENPAESEIDLINACRAHSQSGTKHAQVGSENWQAINSIEMFTSILPEYARTWTMFGYIALARLCSQMNDDVKTLSKRINLTKHFDQNSQDFAKISTIVKHAQSSEQKFLNMFRTFTEEEQEELDTNNQKLYFSWFGLDNLNESAAALEVGPRLNQLTTLAIYAIPAIYASFVHHMVSFFDPNGPAYKEALNNLTSKIAEDKKKFPELNIQATEFTALEKELTEKMGDLYEKDYAKYQKLSPKVEELKNQYKEEVTKSIENYITIRRWINTAYDSAKKELESKKDKLSRDEKTLLNSKSFNDLPDDLKLEFINASTIIGGVGYDGIRNLPNATSAFAKFIYKNLTWNNPVYDAIKENNPWMSAQDARSTARILNFSIGAGLGLYAVMLYMRYQSTKQLLDLIHEKQLEVIAAARLVKSMEMLHSAIGSNATLKTCMSTEYTKFAELFDQSSKNTSADLKNLINALTSWSFQGDDSYLLSLQGKVLATHHLLNRIKGELIPYLEAFGQVDAYLSTATLYQEFKNHPNVHFCLPEFVDAQTPVLEAQEYWHPMIDANKVVTNTLGMNFNQAPNLIITGPNAGGKTTSLMSLIINIIFAQSFGIAPSSSLRLTPFAKVHSYLDITTDLQAGLSLFAAEVDRAKKLKISIMSCKPGQKTFTIIDEIFSGTDPKVASDVGFTFASQLGETSHSMTIITTHFPALTELEAKTKRYVNYKVADAIVSTDGTITYPFKLVKGISTQNIAAQMLHNQGII